MRCHRPVVYGGAAAAWAALTACAGHQAPVRHLYDSGHDNPVNYHVPVDDDFVVDAVGAPALQQCLDALQADATTCSVFMATGVTLVLYEDRSRRDANVLIVDLGSSEAWRQDHGYATWSLLCGATLCGEPALAPRP